MYNIKFTQEEFELVLDVLWDVDKWGWSKESRKLCRNLDERLNQEYHLQKPLQNENR